MSSCEVTFCPPEEIFDIFASPEDEIPSHAFLEHEIEIHKNGRVLLLTQTSEDRDALLAEVKKIQNCRSVKILCPNNENNIMDEKGTHYSEITLSSNDIPLEINIFHSWD